jgi:energy-coupling factor transporter transmembrane protein EcfT
VVLLMVAVAVVILVVAIVLVLVLVVVVVVVVVAVVGVVSAAFVASVAAPVPIAAGLVVVVVVVVVVVPVFVVAAAAAVVLAVVAAVEVIYQLVCLFNQEDPLWMAALWDVTTGTFFPEQDWVHDTDVDGTRPSCWEAATMKEAEICVTGLMNMQSFYAAQMARSPESSVPWDDAFHFRMAVMLQWCKRVVDGRMPHGALLAHTRLTGQEVREANDCILPAAGVDWQQHGREGVAAVKSILQNLGFYPRTVMPIEGRRPPAVPSKRDRNTATKEQGLPSVLWSNLLLVRGVDLWLEDPMMLEEYTWSMLQGGPTVDALQSPVSSGALRPGEYNITFYQQVKGHWFWAMYRDEAQNQLIVKWVRGRCPPGGKRLGCEKKKTATCTTTTEDRSNASPSTKKCNAIAREKGDQTEQ